MLITLAALALDLLGRAHKRGTRRLAPRLVALRNGPTIADALTAGDLVTITTHLAALGADEDTVRRYAGTLGKRVKDSHQAATGRTPMQVWAVGPHGYPIEVAAYSPADPALNAATAGYERTAHLVTA